jgi:lysyl-tRNA synthetase class 2
LRQRSIALAAVRRFFSERGFVEVDTPIRARTPGGDAHVEGVRVGRRWLITSPEFHMKRLLVGGMPRIYQLARCTRADEVGPLHEPEFLMLEWYRAFSGQAPVMRDTERLVATVARAVSGKPVLRSPDGRRIDATPPYPRLTVRDAFRRHAGVADAAELAERDEDLFFQLLVDRVEPALARRRVPVFLCEYPITQASLARAVPHDAQVAERFELYAGGVELCNGFGELTDAAEQKRRFLRERKRRRCGGRPAYPLDDRLLDALHEGMPPAGGNALGVDRLVAMACGVVTIADVQTFPYCRS